MAAPPASRVIVLDTSGLFALLASNDRHHGEAQNALQSDNGPYVVPAGILAEVGYMIETRLGPAVLDAFFSDLVSGAFTYDCAADDLGRMRQLTSRYRDLSLGVADAAVISCAERLRAAILTFDRRDFDVVARETGMSIIP